MTGVVGLGVVVGLPVVLIAIVISGVISSVVNSLVVNIGVVVGPVVIGFGEIVVASGLTNGEESEELLDDFVDEMFNITRLRTIQMFTCFNAFHADGECRRQVKNLTNL